jgi:RimJ/RimL family protein N-acetyltransferase
VVLENPYLNIAHALAQTWETRLYRDYVENTMQTLKLPIQGDRIVIRHPSKSDISDLYEIEADPETKHYLEHGRLCATKEEWIAGMPQFCCPSGGRVRSFRPDCPLVISLKDNGTLIGRATLRLSTLDKTPPKVWQLEVFISKGFWAPKFGEEASKCLIFAAFENLGVPEIFAIIDPKNTHSIDLVSRLKFEKVGTKETDEHLIYKLPRNRQ